MMLRKEGFMDDFLIKLESELEAFRIIAKDFFREGVDPEKIFEALDKAAEQFQENVEQLNEE